MLQTVDIATRQARMAEGLTDPLVLSIGEKERVRVVNATRAIARDITARLEAQTKPFGDIPRHGKTRDTAALDMWCGAVYGALSLGDKALGDHLTKLAAMVIAVRGAAEVALIASKPDETETPIHELMLQDEVYTKIAG